MDKKTASLLSLCSKAGKLVAGEFAAEKALQSNKAKLVIISTDASSNTRKKFTNKAFYYKVPVITYGTMVELGTAIGKGIRSSIVIIDDNFAENVKRKMLGENDGM